MTRGMRVAHCSDPHLLSLAGARPLDFAGKRWLGALDLLAGRARAHRPRVFEAMVADLNRAAVDHVVVTGDLTNVALEGEFRFARRLVDAIDLGPDRVTVLPGNHDAYVAGGTAAFLRHFADHSRPDEGWWWPEPAGDGMGDPWPVVRLRGPLAIVALSTSVVTPWFRAWGRLGEAQLRRLRSVLTDPRLDGLFRLVALHHPPAGGGSGSQVRGLRDRDGFAEVIAAGGAELIVHGHEHRDGRSTLAGPDGPVAVRTIQSATRVAGTPDRRAGYRIYHVAGGAGNGGRPALVGESVRIWEPERERFVAAPACG